jgi:ATP-dependent Zn protease
MKKSNRDQLKFTAYHEAGHAVACVEFGRRFHHVAIKPGDGSLGHMLHAAFAKSFRPDTR